MKILILGISGRTGILVANEAVKRGHEIVGIARDPSKTEIKGVEIIQGTAYDFETVQMAINGCKAVISCLNVFPNTQGIFTKVRYPLDTMSVSMKNTISAMTEKGIRRIVVMTALGVGDSANEVPAFFRFLVKISNIKYAYLEHERQENLLESSALDWTVVRPVMLTDKNENLSILHNLKGAGKIKSEISRNAVAHLMIDCIEKDLFLKQKPGISNQ